MLENGRLLLDPAMTAEEQAAVARQLELARANLAAAYGTLFSAMPRVVWCKTKACVAYFSGTDGRSFATPGGGYRKEGAQHVFDEPSLVITRQARVADPARVLAVETLTHELSHTELRARLRGASVPAWFNEGVATYLGKEHRCEPGMSGGASLADLETGPKWAAQTNRDGQTLVLTYCQASNEVGAWIAEHGGFGAVLELLKKRAAGRSFASLYGPQRTAAAGQN
jgi:hypothetical protein